MFIHRIVLSNKKKKLTIDDMQQNGWFLAILSWVKEARHKWMHTAWFHLFENLARTDRIMMTNGKSVIAMSGVKWTGRNCKETLWDDNNLLHIYCSSGYTNVSA